MANFRGHQFSAVSKESVVHLQHFFHCRFNPNVDKPQPKSLLTEWNSHGIFSSVLFP
jgi:hypothetical protein